MGSLIGFSILNRPIRLPTVSHITSILTCVAHGDPTAGDKLIALTYDELRRLAAAKMAHQPAGQTLQATALVHEAWIRLGISNAQFESRKHFFTAAAQAMRHILIERARRKLRVRHGGALHRVDIDSIEISAPTGDDEMLLAVNSALEDLARAHPDKAEIVKMRFFAGLDENEIAEVLGVSSRTVERHWRYAKAWLFDRIKEDEGILSGLRAKRRTEK